MNKKYVYRGQDITLDVYEKIKATVELLAEKENLPFEDAYLKFATSPVYVALQNTETVLWYESPQYLVDEYYRKATQN